ncbi:small-conductance mechanosensitive channel [Endobacter medicaginis]|uniref:Small-conductance mechanosensitive channel n=2 Tax=Endobacter medicaginis TaxID=1181271 RepID=A0A839UXU1_9PROT|nr:mechanosensitive ion channel family protein [Endobacter medicaginis]MBB3172930.1 small-conductance mechanosensitive channel [Endobacter medicaginis]MCX5474855.1 mechanosensitive ion channel family protein [Endobacter medicaginis]
MNRFTYFMGQVRDWLSWLPAPVAAAAVLVLAGAGAALLGRMTTNAFLRVPGRRGAVVRSFAKDMRRPLRVFLVIVALSATIPVAGLPYRWIAILYQMLLVVFILLVGWSLSIGARFWSQQYLSHMSMDGDDSFTARKHVTQIRVLRRAMDLMILVITVSAALMTFKPVQQYGVSLFASAGAASLIVGLAARPLLTNLIAGVQIAITQPIRLEDAVIVEGEWGWVEEITSTFVVVRLWDWRRMILPISYFLEKPFQNWTHQSASLIGAIYLNLDYRAPIEDMREELARIVRASALWDGNICNLQVSDATERTIQVRMLASARNAPQTWDLRCEIREKMVAFLRANCPEALPRLRLFDDRPGDGPEISPPRPTGSSPG